MIVMVVFGVLGYFMKKFESAGGPFILAFICNFHIQRKEFSFFVIRADITVSRTLPKEVFGAKAATCPLFLLSDSIDALI